MKPVPGLLVSVHDVCPGNLANIEALLAHFQGLPLRYTFLAVLRWHREIPLWKNSHCLSFLRQRQEQGDEVAMHGFYHVDDEMPLRFGKDWLLRRLYTDGEGEFLPLGVRKAKARLHWGKEMLESLGFSVSGFVPPAWLLGEGGKEALLSSGFSYTSFFSGIQILPKGWIQSSAITWSARSSLRVKTSLLFNKTRFFCLETPPLIRVALHPRDAIYPGIFLQAKSIMAKALSGRPSYTKRDYLHACLGEPSSFLS